MKSKIDRAADRKLTHEPEEIERGPKGRGHEQPGLGDYKGSKVHGKHFNVVNGHSHESKLRCC